MKGTFKAFVYKSMPLELQGTGCFSGSEMGVMRNCAYTQLTDSANVALQFNASSSNPIYSDDASTVSVDGIRFLALMRAY